MRPFYARRYAHSSSHTCLTPHKITHAHTAWPPSLTSCFCCLLRSTQVATKFLLDLYDLGEPFQGALKTMLSNFDEPMRESFVEFVAKVESS